MSDAGDRIVSAAERLRVAEETRTPCAPLRDLFAGDDVAAGYAIQEHATRRHEAAGRRLVGRKIGLTSRAVQAQLGVAQPDYGMLWADMAYADAEPVDLSRILQPKAEGEIALVLGRDLDREHLTVVDVLGAVAYALPAIEVVGSRVADWDISALDTIADNASAGAFVLGTVPVPLSAFDPRLCGMVLERRGEPVSVGAGAACLGNPLTAALWLARKMVAVGRPLREGDVVLSGALGPLVAVAPGDVLEVRITGVGSARAVLEAG
ncbi:MAG: fumarylacetoacetate hydrolase family protein [Myxococcota bacterium]